MSFPDPSPRWMDSDNVLLFKIAQILASGGGGGVNSFNTRTGAVTLTLADVSTVADSRYVLKAGDTMTGLLTLNVGSNVVSGQAYFYNGVPIARGQTALGNYFFGAAGNLTMTGTSTSALGAGALLNNTTGTNNNAFGASALFTNTTGGSNSAVGVNALAFNTTGGNNSAVGVNALLNNTTGGSNSAVGINALRSNTTGGSHSAFGVDALRNNTTGTNNNAFGASALFTNTTGISNSAVGFNALAFNTTGGNNSAVGGNALLNNTTGGSNSAFGVEALRNNTTGGSNSAVGFSAGDNITTGSRNIIIGADIDAPVAAGSNQLSLGNIIFGTGLTGTGTTIAGLVGIGTNAPNERLSIVGGAAAVYNTLVSATNFERLDFQWTANVAQIWTEKGSGGGTARALVLGADATELLRFGSATTLSFFAATAVVKQTSGANLTNNVTAGGTDDTIANYTDLVIYANDAATIRNDIYQLARKLKQINDGLRSYGLFT